MNPANYNPALNRLIETDSFPFEFVSILAEKESWRKEIHRPVYHIHKWWAQRLGSVFRGILIACMLPEQADFTKEFYGTHDFHGVSVFDPFMGSGTTVGEAHKLGFTALGRDINPVACESVRVAFGPMDRQCIKDAFSHLAEGVGRRIRDLYRSEDEKGVACDVLYYFWVKNVACPCCGNPVDLFPSRVVARNAYPDRKPCIQVSCPRCGSIFPAVNGDHHECCPTCSLEFDPEIGAASGTEATCEACSKSFRILDSVRATGEPPSHRLYAKLLLAPGERKKYLPAISTDIEAYSRCSAWLHKELESGTIRLPTTSLSDGYNTRQAIGYNYKNWRDFFNDRQLLALGWLQEAISELSRQSTREALLTLFSGVLEFNNLFASYKGEGTGAVRHMFAHHILKPERTPIEANIWGTHKSSGSFSNLFKSRLLRVLDYRDSPFEIAADSNRKVYLPDVRFSGEVSDWPKEATFSPRAVYLSCGSSDDTGLPDRSIDLVVTDPPFFDNVHYSELADFFYSWQLLHPRGFLNGALSTRHPREVQDTDSVSFAAKLCSVFKESNRVLRDEGLLVFTYHHSRPEGWTALMAAIVEGGFSIINAHPVKAEMSVAAPKSQAKEPIQLDIILVCRKIELDKRVPVPPAEAMEAAMVRSSQKLDRLIAVGLELSLNDRRIVVISQFVAALGPISSAEKATAALVSCGEKLEEAVKGLSDRPPTPVASSKPSAPSQIGLAI